MNTADEPFRRQMKILVDQRQDPETGDENQETLGTFKAGHDMKPFCMGKFLAPGVHGFLS